MKQGTMDLQNSQKTIKIATIKSLPINNYYFKLK